VIFSFAPDCSDVTITDLYNSTAATTPPEHTGSIPSEHAPVKAPYAPEHLPSGGTVAAASEDLGKGAVKASKFIAGAKVVGKCAGPIGAVIGIAFSAKEVSAAPPGQKAQVAAKETGGQIGGFAGGEVSAVLGTAAVVGVGILVGVTPVGWVLAGGALVGAVIGGAVGTDIGQKAGSWVHSLFN
jgi:hypothetical protein